MTYPGGKNAVYHQIINQIPPHRVYIEAFAGSAAIARRKRPAKLNYLIDIDDEVVRALEDIATNDAAQWEFRCTDAVTWLRQANIEPRKGEYVEIAILQPLNWLPAINSHTFVYADPPYLGYVRSSARPIYRYEMMTDTQHRRLLDCLKALPCAVMVSGYDSALYRRELSDWRTISFQTTTRGGTVATEWLWMNYPEPTELHDYSYLGDDFRERERIGRKVRRWVKGLQRLPVLERNAILAALDKHVR